MASFKTVSHKRLSNCIILFLFLSSCFFFSPHLLPPNFLTETQPLVSESICSVIMKGNNLTRVDMFWICRRRLGYSRVPALSSSRISVTIVHVLVSGQRASGIVPSSLGNPGHP